MDYICISNIFPTYFLTSYNISSNSLKLHRIPMNFTYFPLIWLHCSVYQPFHGISVDILDTKLREGSECPKCTKVYKVSKVC